jgi:ribosomal-protein-alanine N-acetyltransferase
MAGSNASLSLAQLQDATAIAAMSQDLIELGLDWSWRPARVAASIRDPTVRVLVGRAHDRIIGFGIMRYGDDEAHLDLFGVAREHQRQGVGRQLLEWLEKCAVVAGISTVFLEVRAGNLGAQQFYESMGYRKLTYVRGYYQGVEAAIRMGRDLWRGGTGSGPASGRSIWAILD